MVTVKLSQTHKSEGESKEVIPSDPDDAVGISHGLPRFPLGLRVGSSSLTLVYRKDSCCVDIKAACLPSGIDVGGGSPHLACPQQDLDRGVGDDQGDSRQGVQEALRVGLVREESRYVWRCCDHVDPIWGTTTHRSFPGRFPNHGDAKRIEKEHSEELEKLKTAEGDFFHGIHCGLLAATRMFQDHAEIVEAIQGDDDGGHLIEEAVKFEQKKQESIESFPHVAVDVAPVQKFATVN